jgi:hypothetical protein
MMTSFNARFMRLLRWSGLALALLMFSAVSAQDTPVVTVEAGDFRDLAIIEDGTRLLVADAASDHVRIYDISRMSVPTLITSASLAGTPLALAGVQDFAIVAVRTDGAQDALEVITPLPFNRRFPYMVINYVEVPRGVTNIILSPDGRRGIAIGENAYTLLEIFSPDEISAITVETGRPISAAAITAQRAFIAFEDESALEVLLIRRGANASPEATIALDAPVRGLEVSADGSLIGVLTEDQMVIFDSSALTLSAQIETQASALRFLDAASAELLTLDEARMRIQLYDLQEDALRALNTLELTQAVRQLTTFGDFIFVTGGDSVNIYGVR